MMNELPAPLIPSDVDLRDFAFMPMDIVRLFNSGFHARSNDAEWRAGVTLWLKSFHQVPAGSLPNDDIDLCRLAELGRDMKQWKKVSAMAMRNWILSSDGRFYHATVAEKVLDAWSKKEAQRERSKRGNDARWGNRDNSPNEYRRGQTPKGRKIDRHADDGAIPEGFPQGVLKAIPEGFPQGVLNRSLNDPKGQGQGQGQGQGESKPSAQQPTIPPPAPSRPKSDLDALEAALRLASGLENDPSPGLFDLSPILGFLDKNVSLDETILPILRASKAKGRKGNSWRYYAPAITQAMAERQKNGQIASVSPQPIGDPSDPSIDLGCGRTPRKSLVYKHLAAWIENHRVNRWNAQIFGFPPDEPGCSLPDEILAEFGLERVPYPVEDEAGA
jgi:hypothetical protein